MSETRTTAVIALSAAALAVLTWITAPSTATPAVLSDRGARLFPQLTDANAAASLEVVEYDERTATARPFKVQNRGGRWTIPSQYDYPADGGERLAQTAAALIGLRKDDIASDSPADFERTGVIDPLDTTAPNVGGRGTRLTLRDTRGGVLADIILGRGVENRAGLRYVRQPGQNRTYVSNVGNVTISTAFADWIERDLMQLGDDEIDAISLRQYSLDRATGRVDPGETILLRSQGDGEWTADGAAANSTAVERLLRNLASLRIAGVLPKPAAISATLSRAVTSAPLTGDDRTDLARKGFYLAADGRLVSSQGEAVIRTVRGVFYTLRFGEVAPPSAVAGGAGDAAGENRYLFVMADHDPAAAATAGRAAEGAEKVAQLRARFAPWYYVITGDSFAGIRLRRRDLVHP
jgi:hypothetical protein